MTNVRKDIPVESAETSQRNKMLWVEIDGAAEAKDPDQRKVAVERVTAVIEDAIARDPCAELFFMLGYALYLHPERLASAPIHEKVESALKSALAIDPVYAPAHMYLGHEAFDRREYAEAEAHFGRVDLAQLSTYRAMKVREMCVSCAIALNGLASSLERLGEYVRIAEQHPPPDVMPTELDKWVDGQRHQLNESEEKTLANLWERLARAQRFRR